MWFPMEVHNPGDHVPPADEAGGIVYAHCHADEIAERETQVSPHARSSGGATDLIAPHFLGLLKTVVGQLDELSFCKRIMRRSGPRVEITRRFPKFVKRSHASFPTLGVHPCTLGRCPLLGCVGGHRLRDNRR